MFASDASITHESQTFTLTLAELKECERTGGNWDGPGAPSKWLSTSVFTLAKKKTPSRALAMELAAAALGISRDQLQEAIDFVVNYIRWHDNDPEYDL